MPIFEYQCSKCSEHFEKLVLKGDDAVSCPKCQSSEVQKWLSVCGHKEGDRTAGINYQKAKAELCGGSAPSGHAGHGAGCSCCSGPRVVQKQ